MPYPRYNGGGNSSGGGGGYGHHHHGGGAGGRGYGSSSGQGVSPWQMGGHTPASGNKVDPLALMGSLMGAMMGGAGAGQFNNQLASSLAMAGAIAPGVGGGQRGYDRDRRDRQRVRDRSPPRRSYRSRSRSRDNRRNQRRSSASGSRRVRSPEQRAEHEIYIGNYPVKFKESDVRKLFEDHQVTVGAIRMKHDGLKVFAFAETESLEEVEKAKATMEGVEIQGRKLRVRSSKDTDKKKNKEREREEREERRKRHEREALKKDDVKKHLVTAFVAFLGREFEAEAATENDRFRDLVDTAKTALITAYDLPDDESLAIPRNIEDIFFRDVRNDVKIVKVKNEETDVEVKQEKVDQEEDNDNDDDDDGNWKRKGRGKSEEDDQVDGDQDDEDAENIEENPKDSDELDNNCADEGMDVGNTGDDMKEIVDHNEDDLLVNV